MANQTPLRMLSAVAFIDYVHIKHQVEKLDHDKVTQAVGQHDKDKVEYGEAYEVLEEYLAEAQHYSDSLISYTNSLISSLCSMRVSKGIMTEQEVNEMVDVTQKIWESQLKSEDKDNE